MKCSLPANSRQFVVFSLLTWLTIGNLLAQAPAISPGSSLPPTRKAAIFVFTREPKVGIQQAKMLEDLIAARAAQLGFATLTRDVVVDSISAAMKRPDAAISSKDKSVLEQFAAILQKPGSAEKNPEEQLNEQSSVMRLAQIIGADLIVLANIESFGAEKRPFKGNDLAPMATTTTFSTLLISYRLAYAASGSAVAGDSVRVTRVWRDSDGLTRQTDDLLNGMFDEAASNLVKKISAANETVKEVPTVQAANVQFNVKPVLPGGTPLQLPTYQDGNVKLPVSTAVAADVILDGVSAGSVPGDLHLATGLHQILVSAEGFKPWKRFVTISDGQKFDILLEMTPEGFEKWKEIITFMSDLSQRTKLTDAEVKEMQAKAEAMRKAGLIVTVGNRGLEMIGK